MMRAITLRAKKKAVSSISEELAQNISTLQRLDRRGNVCSDLEFGKGVGLA